MISTFRKLLIPILFLFALLPSQIVSADVGPKPTMEFTFEQTGGLTITSGILYECDQSDCSDAEPLAELGPQRLRCDAASCSALAYGFAPYHRLEITFSDGKTRASNIFETTGFNSLYTVTVHEDDLLVEAKFNLYSSPTNIFYILCVCALAGIILLIGLIVFIVRRSKKK